MLSSLTAACADDDDIKHLSAYLNLQLELQNVIVVVMCCCSSLGSPQLTDDGMSSIQLLYRGLRITNTWSQQMQAWR